jgi:hypothetical protein
VPSKSLVISDFDVIIWQRDPFLEALPDNTTCSNESLLHCTPQEHRDLGKPFYLVIGLWNKRRYFEALNGVETIQLWSSQILPENKFSKLPN